ncbi:hypothetical protein [Acidianus brierleyi]|uniref:Uncharacterized protein n=1 Tax=Acidianus brierleyi TaxID=41673 RepID=A0A2U9IHG4_9CREN|nr:hypothetical protein [Acidianus brierleyi]AWR95415.1 hypothetical protein DFR85_13235 [Acidianus brierleyi]
MKCAVIPINRSDFTFESSFSSIVRTYELFKPEKILILYADFNDVHLQKLKDLLDELKGKGIDIKCVKLTMESFEDFKKLIEEETKGCEKTYLVPTSGANIVAVYLTLLHSQIHPLVNYLFSFGSWIRYYYPFVPRSLENVLILGDKKPNTVNLDLNLDSYLDDTVFTRIIEMGAEKLNKKLSIENDDLYLKLKGKEILSTDHPNYNKTLKELSIIFDHAQNILTLSGAYDIIVDDKKIEDISYGRTLIIDTNLIYYGIHSHEIRDIVIPYCVHNEVLFNVNKKESFSDALFYVYDSLREKSRMIPSESTICDVAIPKIEPDLIRGSLVVTADKWAYERWKKLAISSYTDLKLAHLGKERKDYVNVSNVIFNLAAILCLMKTSEIEVCWKSNGCVKIDCKDGVKID